MSLDLNYLVVTSKLLKIWTVPIFALLVISVVVEVETEPSLMYFPSPDFAVSVCQFMCSSSPHISGKLVIKSMGSESSLTFGKIMSSWDSHSR